MKAALDVRYEPDRAVAAGVVFKEWLDSEPSETLSAIGHKPERYRAGRFYERELPYLLSVLRQTDRQFDTIIIDGYVHLRPEVGIGLGVHLFNSLSYSPAVIGVAKNPLRLADQFVPVLRGKSRKPLYVSAMGCALGSAAHLIKRMYGPHRIPTMLKIADQHARAVSL
jgi:deoxyribonuclease V